jgi:hypothetical protein
MTVVIGCGAGFSGDRTNAAGPLVEALLAYDTPRALMFETLGERTLAAAQLRRMTDPGNGDEPLLEAFLAPVLGDCLAANITVLLGNFGAANPRAARGPGSDHRTGGGSRTRRGPALPPPWLVTE